MVKAVTWLLCAYATLKLVQLVFGSRPAANAPAPGVRGTLLRGEPMLFGIAFAIAVPAALWSSWYVQRGYHRGLERSAACYGRLRALDALPAVRGRFDPYKVFRAIDGAKGSAALAGQALALSPATVSATLADRMRVEAARYPGLARQADRDAIATETDRVRACLTQPLLSL